MIWVLNRTFFKPINRVIEARERQKGGHGSEAESILSDVSEKQAKYNKELLAARSEGYELIEKERSAAIAQRQSKIADAKAETAQVLTTGKQKLEEEAAQARSVIADEAVVMAEKISANILKS